MTANFIGNSLFISLITLQVAAALVPIRNWPLSDYPMFSAAIKEFDSISRFAVEDVYEDQEIPWSRTDYQSVGLNDHRLQYYVDETNFARIRELLSEKVQKNPRYVNKHPQTLRLYKVTIGPESDGQLKKQRELVKEFSFEELRK